MMTKNFAANAALFLMVLAWPLMMFGIARQMGDASPSVPIAQIEARYHFAMTIFWAGALSFFAAVVLALFAKRDAKVRARIVLAVAALPVVLFVATLIIPFSALLR